MAAELSSILEHVERVSELDLDDVPTTTHVVAAGHTSPQGASRGALRADEPRPSLPRDAILAAAPATEDGGFVVPSPQA